MPRVKREKWSGVRGGFIIRDARKCPTYYVRRRVDGVQREVALASTEAAALAALARWEADPHHWRRVEEAEAPLLLNADRIVSFLRWSLNDRHNSAAWVRQQKRALRWWAEKLGARDLRKLDLRADILPSLEGEPGRSQRSAVLKTLFSWMRQHTHELKLAEDPVAGALHVEQTRPEQWRTVKTFSQADYEAVRDDLRKAGEPLHADAATVQAATGWHCTELVRFNRTGKVQDLPATRAAEGAAQLLCPATKAGAPLRTIVGVLAAEAARRLVGVTWSGQLYSRALSDSCARLTTEARKLNPKAPEVRVLPGSFRHSVATWAVESGAAPQAVAAFLNHKSPRTTQRFYATHAAPQKVPTLA